MSKGRELFTLVQLFNNVVKDMEFSSYFLGFLFMRFCDNYEMKESFSWLHFVVLRWPPTAVDIRPHQYFWSRKEMERGKITFPSEALFF